MQTIDFIAQKIWSLVIGNALKLPDLSQILKTLINPTIDLPKSVNNSGNFISAVKIALRKACPYWHDEGTSIFYIIDRMNDVIEHHDSTSGDQDQSQADVNINNHPLELAVSHGHNIYIERSPKADLQEMLEKMLHHQACIDTFFSEHVVGYKDGCTEFGIAYVCFNPQGMDKKASSQASARAATTISQKKHKQYTVVLLDVHECKKLYAYLHRNNSTKQKEDIEQVQIDRNFTETDPDSYGQDQNSSNDDLFNEPSAKEDGQLHDLNSQSVVTGYSRVHVDVTYTEPSASPFCNMCPMLVSKGYMYNEPEQPQEEHKPFPFFKQISCGEMNGYDSR